MRMAYLSALVAGVLTFVLSVAWLGVWPARMLEEQTRREGPATSLGLSESESRGRLIYAREGCSYCHTQQVRFTPADRARFGEPTLAWESRRDFPHMMGTRRIGPDLSRTAGTRSADWHFAHLFAPRTVVADSVMPSYVWLFDEAPDRPRQEARDLVAYLESLGRDRRLAAGPGKDATVNPAATRREGPVPELPDGDSELGARVYASLCSSCHGPDGRGDGSASPFLRPKPAILSSHRYTRARLAEALWHGVPGTSMPAWRDRSMVELAALSSFVRERLGGGADDDRVVTDAQRALGPPVYAANCAQCHGVSGAGDGWAGALLDVKPANFQTQSASVSFNLRVIDAGVDGTMMGPWASRLTEDERVGVAAYIRTFFRGDR